LVEKATRETSGRSATKVTAVLAACPVLWVRKAIKVWPELTVNGVTPGRHVLTARRVCEAARVGLGCRAAPVEMAKSVLTVCRGAPGLKVCMAALLPAFLANLAGPAFAALKAFLVALASRERKDCPVQGLVELLGIVVLQDQRAKPADQAWLVLTESPEISVTRDQRVRDVPKVILVNLEAVVPRAMQELLVVPVTEVSMEKRVTRVFPAPMAFPAAQAPRG